MKPSDRLDLLERSGPLERAEALIDLLERGALSRSVATNREAAEDAVDSRMKSGKVYKSAK